MSESKHRYRLTPRRKQIADLFCSVDADNPSKSDEWLIAMTCDLWFIENGHQITNADVCEALIAAADAKSKATGEA